jgi:hypothetical protein
MSLVGFKIKINHKNDHTIITTSGDYTYEGLCEFIETAAKEIKKNAWKNLCVDIINVVGMIPGEDRFNLGVFTSQRLTAPVSIAVIYRESEINKLFEHVDWDEGVQVTVVASIGEALDWLHSRS